MDAASYEQWMTGDAVKVGRAIMAPLSARERVARAVAVLDLCRIKSKSKSMPGVDRVSVIGKESSRWREGHDFFRAESAG